MESKVGREREGNQSARSAARHTAEEGEEEEEENDDAKWSLACGDAAAGVRASKTIFFCSICQCVKHARGQSAEVMVIIMAP